MLRSTRRGIFRHSYDVSEDGTPLATLTGVRREGCVFDIQGESYEVTRDGRRSFRLTGPAGEVARAERANTRLWTIGSLVETFELIRTSIWKETWELRRLGKPVGTLRKDGAFKRTSTAEVPDDLPLPVRLFVLYVVETLWERSRQSASAGAAS